MKKATCLFQLFIICTLFLGACNLPSENQNAQATSAAETIQALQSAVPATSTPGVVPPTLTLTPTSTNTVVPTATPTCPQAQFITDITFPDGSVVSPGQAFTKKWRLRNSGDCAWNGYTLVFDTGDSMGGPASKPIGIVNPGQEVDLELNLTAPVTAGNYRGYWRIATNNNVLVPILNGYQGRAFYVDIKVQAPPTNTTPPFSVTGVTLTSTGGCGGFVANASITTNGPGTVTYTWKFSDGAVVANDTLTFASAGTQTVSRNWSTNASGSYWIDIQIISPNNQQFGRAQFTCP